MVLSVVFFFKNNPWSHVTLVGVVIKAVFKRDFRGRAAYTVAPAGDPCPE